MKVLLTVSALEDLESAYSFYLENSPAAGAVFGDTLLSVFDHLCANPEGGRKVAGASVRKWTMTNFPYLVFYRVQDDAIEVLSIFNTNRSEDNYPD